MSTVSSKANYTNKDIVFVYNSRIDEYDMKSAGFSVIKQNGLLPPEEISRLERMEKQARNIEIGKIRGSNYKFSRSMAQGVRTVMQSFISTNNIKDEKIISIKNDAVFVLDTPISVTSIDGIDFVLKNSYSSFLNMNNIEFYYKNGVMDIKGLSDSTKSNQHNFLLDHIRALIFLKESGSRDSMIRTCSQYNTKYLNRTLPIQHYEELTSQGGFMISDADDSTYYTNIWYELADEQMKPFIDISYNYLRYILPFTKILLAE